MKKKKETKSNADVKLLLKLAEIKSIPSPCIVPVEL